MNNLERKWNVWGWEGEGRGRWGRLKRRGEWGVDRS